jgi:hypothetical protein
MRVLICPVCGAENSLEALDCHSCQASLEGILPSDLPERVDEVDNLSEPPDDLPGLLQSLKEDHDEGGLQPEEVVPVEGIKDIFDDGTESDDQEEEVIPEWLDRIRQRANEEPDAKGEITQKISTAIENITDEKREDRLGDYQSWLDSIRSQKKEQGSGDSTTDESEKIPSEEPAKDGDWLIRIRSAEGKLPEEPEPVPGEIESPDDKKGDSLLQWLVAIEEGKEPPCNIEDAGTGDADGIKDKITPEALEKDADTTQKITVEKSKTEAFRNPMIEVSGEEQQLADRLSAILEDEKVTQIPMALPKKSPVWMSRILISLFLILSVIGSVLVTQPQQLPEIRSPQSSAVLAWAVDLQEGSPVLVIFDYQPGYASEVEIIAEPILRLVIAKNNELFLLSSSASGSVLAQNLLQKLSGSEAITVEDFGFYPIGAFGGYQIANQAQAEIESPYLPETRRSFPTEPFEGILVLSDRAEGARAWVEQLSVLMPDAPVFLLLTAQAGPMSLPYWEAHQVDGMISGFSDAAGILSTFSESPLTSAKWQAYQVGIILMMAIIVVGAIFFSVQGVVKRRREKQ